MGKIAELTDLSQEMMSLLRLRTMPVGIKLFEHVGDIPSDFEMIEEECAVCQLIGRARYAEKAVAAVGKTLTSCPVGCYSLGMCDAPPSLDESAGKWGKTPEAGMKMALDRSPIQRGKFEAMGTAPLNKMSVEPDVVQIWCRPYQIECLLMSSAWDGTDKLTLASNGHGASCYETLAVPYLTGKSTLAVADQGDRWHAWATEDEMILGSTLADFKRLVTNVREATTEGIYYLHNYNPFQLTYNPKYSARVYMEGK